ncbi:DUF2931 family protein [Pedobacter punctiformis]|uniref:DUF2931 family protein n=1 Tax=Pedobacter punctiformis TaxID=3004097 RepID=A0ABT4LCE9_9SPHI|nr:DUF2931 family protein [Pedobacter sp. HCMS5-2]MCZ4245595.1 DUF2931 family protein [Pedobacter sp. HCMS5-2]
MFKERANIINIVLGAILGFIIIAIIIKVINYKGGERFEWRSGVYTRPGNTVQVAECNFFHSGYWAYPVRKDQILNSGVENINYTENSKDNSFYPDSLKICWFSYTERKFYEGDFLLPYRLIKDMAKELRSTTKEYSDYAKTYPDHIELYFFAELLPGGKLTVWLSDRTKYLEIGKYQAKEVKRTWEIFDDRHSDEKPDKIDIPTQVALVMDQYPHTIEVHSPESLSLRNLDVEPYNQANWHLDKEKPEIPVFKNIPKNISFTWGNDQKEYSTECYFKDGDILSAFKRLQSLPGNNQMVLQIKVNDTNNKVTVSLKKGSTVIDLQSRFDAEIYERVPQKED